MHAAWVIVLVLAQTAQEHYEEGQKLFRLGRFAEAIEHFERAYEKEPLAELLFNIAQSHRNLGACDKADYFYKSFAQATDDVAKREVALKLRTECQPAPPKDVVSASPVTPAPPAAFEPVAAPLVAPAPEPEPWWRSPWPWVGATVAVLATGVVLALVVGDGESNAPSGGPPSLGTIDVQ
jgi:hypothetical protein